MPEHSLPETTSQLSIGRTVRLWGHDWRTLLAAAVFAALPTVGAFAGGSYAALVIGLAAVLLIAELIERRRPEFDRPLVAIAGLFVVLLWATVLWSITPDRSLRASAQMTGLAVACLVFLGLRRPMTEGARAILAVVLVAAAVGPALVLIDMAAGHPILAALLPVKADDEGYYVKLGRGLGQLDILIWPALAFAWVAGRRAWGLAAAALLFALLAILGTTDLAVCVAFAVGLLTLAIAALAPRMAAYGLGVLVTVAALAGPAIARFAGMTFASVASEIKNSERHRLEIWDYTARRIFERPLTGWGWQSASALPIHPDEKARYEFALEGAPHSHNFWLQLWVETGVVGALLGLALGLVVLRRAWRQPSDVRPFALAAFATAFFLSLPSYNLSHKLLVVCAGRDGDAVRSFAVGTNRRLAFLEGFVEEPEQAVRLVGMGPVPGAVDHDDAAFGEIAADGRLVARPHIVGEFPRQYCDRPIELGIDVGKAGQAGKVRGDAVEIDAPAITGVAGVQVLHQERAHIAIGDDAGQRRIGFGPAADAAQVQRLHRGDIGGIWILRAATIDDGRDVDHDQAAYEGRP